jgi:NADH-quinone oxidoreductase subunit L
MSPTTMFVVAMVGALTAIFAATIGFAQNDIKRVLAYSTVSQLGFMFVAMGVGAFTAGIFHLMTHAFFKACLFLGSGSVIHAMHHALHHAHLDDDAQDMRNMGGLRKKMPITFATFGISCLAISGLPFFSGFFSKDEILWWAFASTRGSMLVWGIAVIAAFMTAFYMFRCLYMTFYGAQRTNAKAKDHVHESPWLITLPLVVLAFLATVGGLIGIPHVLGSLLGHIPNKLEHFLAPVFEHSQKLYQIEAHGSAATEFGLMGFSVVVALIGITLATIMYIKNPELPGKFTAKFSKLHRIVFNKWYVDEAYDALFVNSTKKFGLFCWKGFDVVVIDGIVNGAAKLVGVFAATLRHTQTGLFQNYALTMVLGTVVMVAIFILN